MIGVATIVVDQITTIVVGIATIVVFLRQLWLVLRQLWLIATIVNIATIVITSGVLTQLNSQTVTGKTTDRSQPATSNETTEYNLSNHRICYMYVMANKLYWKP